MKSKSTPYLRDPQEIYDLSMERVRKAANLDQLEPDAVEMAVRIIHACGMPDIANDLMASSRIMEKTSAALVNGAPILCDCTMVAAGITRRFLPSNNRVVVTLDTPGMHERAVELGTTRSAAAVEEWHSDLKGAVVAIGNAPTALFHLMERLAEGWPKPAAILGFPVGFVGAAESKQWLAALGSASQVFRGVEFITLKGTRGGSAMASAAVNAAAILASQNTEKREQG